MIRPIINAFNWKYLPKIIWCHIWRWKYLIIMAALIGVAWWIYGCSLIPVATNATPSASQSLIDEEVERVSGWNEALRKLKAAGCSFETTLHMVDEYTDSNGIKYFKYECKDNNGVMHKLRKFNDRWVIHGE